MPWHWGGIFHFTILHILASSINLHDIYFFHDDYECCLSVYEFRELSSEAIRDEADWWFCGALRYEARQEVYQEGSDKIFEKQIESILGCW